jgi:hypothetical protein
VDSKGGWGGVADGVSNQNLLQRIGNPIVSESPADLNIATVKQLTANVELT